jgi:hypothetical protein
MISKNKLKDGDINYYANSGTGANGIYNCRVQSVTDSGEALKTARAMFHSSSYDLSKADRRRTAAQKMIVFFTDGEPTEGIGSKETQEMLSVAGQGNGNRFNNSCESDGIAIFTISLNLDKEKAFAKLKERQLYLLDDQPPQPGESGGIAWRAGHGGRYYHCEDLTKLKTAFSDIARRFTESQR